jgi:hypothetical protein
MKRVLLLTAIVALVTAGTAGAQVFEDYIHEMRGDTAVVKNLVQMGEVNSLLNAITYDTNPPAGRVYMLQRGAGTNQSLYLQDIGNNEPYVLPTRDVTIVGPYVGPMVQGTEAQGRPPLIAGTVTGAGDPISFGFMRIRRDFTLKNLALVGGAADGTEGWFPFEVVSHQRKVTWDNVLMEHSTWVFLNSNDAANTTFHVRNSYFINMTGLATRRNGGVYDSVNNRLLEIVAENNTHVQAAGMMYKFRNHRPERAFFNHNTFVNATGQILTTFGYETNFTVSNNLFVNSNVQAYTPGLDQGETDQDNLPHGIINVNHLPGSIAVPDAERKILVDRNGVYWDPRLEQIVTHLRDNNVPCPPDNDGCPAAGTPTNWMTQMITMNSRTQEIFNNNERYPLIRESNWYMAGDPGFTSMPDKIDGLITWGIAAGPGGTETLMPKLRSAGNEASTGVAENFLRFDWPVAVDLTYSNETYLTGALGGYPLGDLNWWPTQKAAWEAEKDELHAELTSALNEGRTPGAALSLEPIGGELPTGIELDQNYPNPFNPSTTIRFAITNPTQVTLDVFDVMGRRVATLVNRELSAGAYNVSWDARNDVGQTVSSGVYLYRLQAGDVVQTKQMTFVK